MKANSRKRVLISSVAMLLVAIVALGTSTYAWFKQSPTATASGVVLKATASNGLKILTESHKAADPSAEYLSQDFLKYDSTKETSSTTPFLLNPASYAFATDENGVPTKGDLTGPFKTVAAAAESSDADANAPVEGASAGYAAGDVYAEKIFCKLVGAADENATTPISLGSLNVDLKTTALKSALRFIVAYNGKVIGAYTASDAAITDGASLTEKATKYSEAEKGTVDFAVLSSAANVPLGNVGTNGNDYVTVYAYLDGESSVCSSSNIPMSNLIDSITVTLTIATD